MVATVHRVLPPQTITTDGEEIVLPVADAQGELVAYVVTGADSSVELVSDPSATVGLRINAQGHEVVRTPWFRLASPNLPKYIRLGNATTVRVTVLGTD